ncbi:MAG: hypothetical protein KDK70_02930 [Myxococcales bacterium]|nr:hypothetical protein [Myxococcales bacterium]
MFRTVLTSALLTATLVPSAGCWMTNPETPVIEAEDVTMEIGGDRGFRVAGERGDVYALATEVSGDTNRWVAEIAVGMSRVVRELSQYPEDRTEGDWRVYGPHDDENGKDGAWLARIQGDENGAIFEVYIGRRGASPEEMSMLIDGEITVDEAHRDGAFTIDFDTIFAYRDLLDDVEPDAEFGGKIAVTFDRRTESKHKQVELDFDGFHYDDGDEDYDFDGEHYTYRREADGAGQFHFATQSSFEQSGWSGPELERMVVDMTWNSDNEGRARGMVLESEGMGDLRNGDIVIHECFDDVGEVTWRTLNEEYLQYEPHYNVGEESACVFAEADLEIAE